MFFRDCKLPVPDSFCRPPPSHNSASAAPNVGLVLPRVASVSSMTYPPPHEPFSQSRRNSTLRTAHPVEPSSGANNLTAFLSNACPAQPRHLAHFAGTGHHSPPFLAQANHIPHQPHPRLSVYASIDAHVSRSSINFVIPRPSKIPFRLANHPHQATALTPIASTITGTRHHNSIHHTPPSAFQT